MSTVLESIVLSRVNLCLLIIQSTISPKIWLPISQGAMPAQTVSGPSFDSPILVDAVLALVKAYRLKGDIDSLKRLVSERFSSEVVDKAKRSLWDFVITSFHINCVVT